MYLLSYMKICILGVQNSGGERDSETTAQAIPPVQMDEVKNTSENDEEQVYSKGIVVEMLQEGGDNMMRRMCCRHSYRYLDARISVKQLERNAAQSIAEEGRPTDVRQLQTHCNLTNSV